MKGTQNYAPPRKGMSHGKKSQAPGTGNYWLKLIRSGEVIKQHDFQALSEYEAASLALSFCSLEKPDTSEWAFVHECSRHRGYEITISDYTLQLFHILRDE